MVLCQPASSSILWFIPSFTHQAVSTHTVSGSSYVLNNHASEEFSTLPTHCPGIPMWQGEDQSAVLILPVDKWEPSPNGHLWRDESASFESMCLVPFIGQPVMLSLGFGSSIPLETLSLQMYLMMAATDTVKCPYTMVVLTRSLQVLQEKRTYPTCLG